VLSSQRSIDAQRTEAQRAGEAGAGAGGSVVAADAGAGVPAASWLGERRAVDPGSGAA
jgi:hypothetical protein